MSLTSREVEESPVTQGSGEQRVYIFNFTKPCVQLSGTPSSPVNTLLDSRGNDVSSTNLTGSAAASGYFVTCKTVTGLKAGEIYTLYCKATISGQIFEDYLVIHAKR
jgi:hypothetical protein